MSSPISQKFRKYLFRCHLTDFFFILKASMSMLLMNNKEQLYISQPQKDTLKWSIYSYRLEMLKTFLRLLKILDRLDTLHRYSWLLTFLAMSSLRLERFSNSQDIRKIIALNKKNCNCHICFACLSSWRQLPTRQISHALDESYT